MEFSQLLETRRSIRAYKPGTEISREDIEKILSAAQKAPSWKNSQTGRYYVVTSPEKLAEVKEKCLPDRNRANCANAPVLIVTAFEKNCSGFRSDGAPENELGDKWGAYDLGLQNQNLIMQARELGFDTLIMGIRDEKQLRTVLDIPETQDVVAVISLGYRDIDPEAPKRKPLDEIAKFL